MPANKRRAPVDRVDGASLCEVGPDPVNLTGNSCRLDPGAVSTPPMSELPAADRIDAAVARIETAIAARAAAGDALARRHDALKARMAEAVAALDDVIARGAA